MYPTHLIFSIPYFTLLCSLWRQSLQFLYYRELIEKKNKKNKNTNQRKKKSISDLLVMARPERVAFGSLASPSYELMNARMTSLESFSPPELMASLSCSSLPLSSVSLLSALTLSSFHVLAFLSVGWPALTLSAFKCSFILWCSRTS